MRRFAAIPAHPQKQYTRRWRLYHFCGFYYPIREVIPIAIYHWNIGIVSRGKGKSAVAAAAYRSGEKLTNEWDGMTHDYTRKGGVVHTEIMLPPHAPPSFSDRSTLWNSVELYEKAGNAQLAREIDAALPIELSREEQIRLVREYCSSQFVSRGMCVDYAIHDTDSGNPHCHIMLTMRPLDERGAWAAKSKKEYDLDENGERIRLPSGRYKTHKVDLTGWNDKDNTLLWRKVWADFTNDFLERNGSPERIDHRSNAERGIDELPTVHMGVAACQMEKKGIATEKDELNRNIQKTNRLIQEIRAQIGKLKEWIADLFKARETAPKQPSQSPNLANLLMKYLSVQREKSRKYSQRWQQQHTADELKTIAAAVNYLSEHGISNLDELDASLSSVSDKAYSIREGMKTAEQRIGDEKTALFLIMSDTDTTFNFILAMVQSQLINLLCDRADDKYGGRLPVHVRMILDEFANIGQIPNFDKLIATIRSREISASIILQSQSQLKAIYKDAAEIISDNCDCTLFLSGRGKNAKEISDVLGKETIDSYNQSENRGAQTSHGLNYQKLGKELMSQDEIATMDGGKCILQVRGVRPFFSEKYDITRHPRYKYLSDADKKNYFDVDRYLTALRRKRQRVVSQEETFDLYDIDLSDEDLAAVNE